jgi:hypothetical protein
MTHTVALIALVACGEVHAAPLDTAEGPDVAAEYFYPVTPTKMPATLVIGMSDGRARRVAPSDVVEVVHTTAGAQDSVALVTTTDSVLLMEGPQLADLAEQVQYWTGAKLRKVGEQTSRTRDDVEGPETFRLDPKAPTTMPYWQVPVILGALDKKAMDDVVWSHAGDIRACVKDNAASGAARGGLLAVKFTVAKDGRVDGAQVRTSTVGSPTVEQCVVDRFESMEFRSPKGGGSVIATYSMILTPVP